MARKTSKSANLEKIKDSIDQIGESKKPIARMLLARAEFMQNTLVDLEKIINAEGAVTTAVNGNGFCVTSEHPAQKSYNTMIGRYNAVLKTILDILGESNTERDELLEFIER